MSSSLSSLTAAIDHVENTIHAVEKKWKKLQSGIRRHALQREIQ